MSSLISTLLISSTLISSVLISSLLISRVNCADNSRLSKYFKPTYNLYEPKILPNISLQDELSARLFHFMAGGLSDIVWSRIPDIITNQSRISHECIEGLKVVIHGIDRGYMSAFQIIDASAKKPIGLIDGTLSFWGDYDQCLAIDGASFKGKYCPINLMPLSYKHLAPSLRSDIFHLEDAPLKSMGFFFALCFPSNCTYEDVGAIVRDSIQDYPLELNLYSCESYQDIKYWNRLTNMTYLQIFSLLTFFGIMNQVLWTSLYDILVRYGIISPNFYIETYLQPILDIFSGYRNTIRIFYVKKYERKSKSKADQKSKDAELSGNQESSSFLDYFKLWILLLGIAGHVGYNLDSPFGVYLIGHHQLLLASVGDFFSQPFINETRVVLMNFFSGLITFSLTADLIKKKKFNFLSSILDKYMRHAPSIFGLLVLEFLWPLLFSGPLYRLQGAYSYEKCSNMWIWNLLLLGNLGNRNGLETCISHTYYSAVDFQLYILGVAVVYTLFKAPKKGLMAIGFLIGISNAIMALTVHYYDLEPVPITKRLDPLAMSMYFDSLHLSTSSYISPYFTGILIAYLLSIGFKLDLSSNMKRYFWLSFGLILYLSADFMTSLYNTFEIIPKWFNPIFVLIPRLFYVCAASILILYSFSVSKKRKEKKINDNNQVAPGSITEQVIREDAKESDAKESDAEMDANQTERQENEKSSENSNACVEKVDSFKFDFLKGISRLAFAIYIVNIWQIKLDFYTSTQIFENFPYQYFKRLLYISYFTLQSAFLFQLFFVAPADNMRHIIKHGYSKLSQYLPGMNESRYREVLSKEKSE